MRKLSIAAMVALSLALVMGPAGAKEWTKVRIGVEGAYPPFSYKNPDGSLGGFDVDIAIALCEAMAVECDLVEQDWDGIIPALQAKKFDAIIASMSITPDRMKVVDFTNKYYHTPAKFVVKEGVTVEESNEGMKDLVVGVQRGTTHEDYMNKKFPDVELKLYGTQDEVYLDMGSGRIDAIMADSVAMDDGFIKTDQGAGFVFLPGNHNDPAIYGEGAGIAVRKSDGDLKEKFNMAIDKIRADGTYQEIAAKYFDFDVYGD